MAVNLLTPVLNTRTPAVNFFNGRLLSGEDLTTEHRSGRAARALLGQAIGTGVVYGLEVSEPESANIAQAPVVTVTKGLAVNPNGVTLLLESDVDVALTRPATPTAGSTSVFQDCAPTQTGAYVAGAGVYLLTVGPASADEGLAQVIGTSTTTAPCNSDYKAYGVQFRLLQLDFSQGDLNDANHLQNTVAYRCFGVANWDALLSGSFAINPPAYGLIDQLRQSQLLTPCEVPLATLYWTAADGIVFVDMWSVRRPMLQSAASSDWPLYVGDRRTNEGEAMFLQFQDQIDQLVTTQTNIGSISAMQYFNYLPPVGVLPLAGATASPGFSFQAFFGQGTRSPVFIPAARMEGLIRMAMPFRPVNIQKGEGVWLYQIVDGPNPLPYLIFTSIFTPYQGSAQFDMSTWDFSNFL